MNPRAHLTALGLAVCLTCEPLIAAEVAADDAPKVSASINASYYAMRDEPDFGVGVVAVNRGPFRFEARYNYEAKHSTSDARNGSRRQLNGWR